MNTKKMQNKLNEMKYLLYKPISDHDEVWYFGWLGMLSRGKYKVAKRFNSPCFRKRKDAGKFKSKQQELFNCFSDIIEDEMQETFEKQIERFCIIGEMSSTNNFDFKPVNPIGGYSEIPEFLTLRGSLKTGEIKLRRMIERGETI